jgi:hypothetical protein
MFVYVCGSIFIFIFLEFFSFFKLMSMIACLIDVCVYLDHVNGSDTVDHALIALSTIYHFGGTIPFSLDTDVFLGVEMKIK